MPSESLQGISPGLRSAFDYRVAGTDDAATFERMVADGSGLVVIGPGLWTMPRVPSWGTAVNVEVVVLPGVQIVGGGAWPAPANGNWVRTESLRGVVASAGRGMPPVAQSIPAGVETAISFGDPSSTPLSYDTGGYWDAGYPTRLTAPATGIYHVSGGLGLAASSVGTVRVMLVRLNGGAITPLRVQAEALPSGSVPWRANAGMDFALQAGDYLQLLALHDATLVTGTPSPLNTGPFNQSAFNRGISTPIGLSTLSGSADTPALTLHYVGSLP